MVEISPSRHPPAFSSPKWALPRKNIPTSCADGTARKVNTIEKNEVVFPVFGIVAPEYNGMPMRVCTYRETGIVM